MIPPRDWPVYHHPTLDSTSDEARRMVKAGIHVPFIVRADRQTRGRGRGANAWWSDAGSLLFTIALGRATSGLKARHEPCLALIAAVAVIEAIEANFPGIGLGIRWPNDVESRGRKLAGVLPERMESQQGTSLLIGIGINVTTRFDQAPEDARELGTSVRTEWGDDQIGKVTMFTLLTSFLDAFQCLLPALARDDLDLLRRWNALDQLVGRPIRVKQLNRIIQGVGRGIDAGGSLLLETDRGLQTISGGQVLRALS